MKKIIVLCFTALLLTTFSAGDLFSVEKTKAQPTTMAQKKTERSSIQTFLGKVIAIDPAKKTMTVKATMEGEFFLTEKDTVLRELVIEEVDITFNTTQATIVGNKTIAPGDTVRVGYDKEKDTYMAHTVLKIEKKGK